MAQNFIGEYTSSADLRKLFKKIDTAGLTDDDLGFFITMVEANINSCIGTRYTLPFSSTPPVLRSLASELSLLKVMDRFFTGETNSENPTVDKRKEDAQKLLDEIANGEKVLLNSSLEVIGQRTDLTGLENTTENVQPIFDLDNVSRSVVDPDLIEDLRNEKDDFFRK